MATNLNRKISAASARAHTRKATKSSSFQLPLGIFKKVLIVFFVGFLAYAYNAIQPPPAKTCGSPDGPSVTAPRIKLRDGRYLAYKEAGVSKESAENKIVFVHGIGSCRHDTIAKFLSPKIIEELGIYIVSYDRPGYGESDPDPKRTVKSVASDIEELADQLGLGKKFYVIGFSMGGQAIWSTIRYIPHRLSGAALIAPVVNYWWAGFPANLSTEAYNQQFKNDQWALRVAHYTPWLTYWWNTQTWFPSTSALSDFFSVMSSKDREILVSPTRQSRNEYMGQIVQQGNHESLYRDVNVGFGNWEFSPLELENPFSSNNEGSVHIWQGDEDMLVPVSLQRYIAHRLPWIKYHELPGSGHLFPEADGTSNMIVKELLTGKK